MRFCVEHPPTWATKLARLVVNRPLGRAADERERTLGGLTAITIEYRRKGPHRKHNRIDLVALHRRREAVAIHLLVLATLNRLRVVFRRQ